jgi:copper chaperone CopZ
MKVISGIVFCLLLFACDNSLRHAEIPVSGNCEMCKETIEEALKIPGIKKASWDPEIKILEVDFDPKKISLRDIRQKVADAGYDTDSLKADARAYSELHECCRYREENP